MLNNLAYGKPLKKEGESVLRSWLTDCDFTIQSAALTGIRGYDLGVPDEIKHLIRWVRGILLKDGRPNNGKFVRSDPPILQFKEFIAKIEYMSFHYVWHFAHSLQIIGYLHPDEQVRSEAIKYYNWICKKSHITPETKEEMIERLSDSLDPKKGVDYS